MQQWASVEVGERNIDARTDQREGQSLPRYFFELASDAKLLVADAQAASREGVELQHDILIHQRGGSGFKLRARRCGLGFQRAVVGEPPAYRAHLNQPRGSALRKIGHGRECDLARLIAA